MGSHFRRSKLGGENVTRLLLPLVRAYFLGYLSTTAPRLLTLLLTLRKTRKGNAETWSGNAFRSVLSILRGGLDWQRFPTFCAVLVGGSTLLQIPLRKLFCRLADSASSVTQERLTRWLSTFIAAWLSIKLLQYKEGAACSNQVPKKTDSGGEVVNTATKLAGRTMDLTLFAVVRAVDVIVGEVWARRRTRRLATNSWTRAERLISALTDPSIFVASCALIMWSFIYVPERLPRAYNKWISGAAAVDTRLLIALRRCRCGELVYGQETGQASLLQSMCIDYKWPQVWGDPTESIPFPCDMVHMGLGKSCESHAAQRFIKGFLMAASMYGPINFALYLPSLSKGGFKRAVLSSARSSAFLGAFIALFYYGVCLARTRIGPQIIGRGTTARQVIDSGVCIGSGCLLCGWSIFLESPGRRKDISLFVAPRALATVLPRRYQMQYQWRETLMFAISAAVVFTCAQENPERVRGVLGRILATIFQS